MVQHRWLRLHRELANHANIPFFCFDVSADGGEVVSTIHTDNYEGGRMAAEYCLKNILTDGTGNCIIIPYEEVESAATALRALSTIWPRMLPR